MPDDRRLIIHRSNRLEALLECLVAEVRRHPPPPLIGECVVVQSRGMATWLSQNLARRCGVWANPDFPHPRRFIEGLLKAALGAEAEAAISCSRELITLAILEILPQLVRRDEFAPLRRYLQEADDEKSLQLAERIAYVFDQYLVYRPEMVLAWEEEQAEPAAENRWQALLWRRLAARHGSPARLFHQAHDRLARGRLVAPELLPPRVFLFGITTLPPVYLWLLNEAAKLKTCHLLLFSPARDYWADIHSPRAINRLLLRQPEAAVSSDELHLAGGHPLLASLGAVGREFQEIVEELAEYGQTATGECFVVPPPQTSMLNDLQRDILELRHPAPRRQGEHLPPAAQAGGTGNDPGQFPDHSIVVHLCHSPLREVEILQDQILAMLDEQGYHPRDIVVMVPDIDLYAPLIEAVFRRPANDRRYIPFRIADRRISREAPLLDALLALFELARGRLPISQVLDFLAREPVRRGFGLDGRQLGRIEQWLEQGRVCWGSDEEHRQRHDQPPDRQNTWRFGLDRLLLGYALPDTDGQLLAGILPLDDIEGQDARLAGVLLNFTTALFNLAAEVRGVKTPAAWSEVIRRALADFFAPDERAPAAEAGQRQSLRDALVGLSQDSERAGLARPLELPALLRLLRARLDEAGVSAGFLEGGLTFCTMLPMRTVPFPVVCLLGMNDGVFPRQHNPAGFDLLAAEPRPGDRSRRRDDRYLFLESLLSARHRFYLSYVGRSIKDNTRLPPSALVDELLDCLALMGHSPADLVTEHPLQPFSARYFQPKSSLFTYAAEYAPGPPAAPMSPAGPSAPSAASDPVAAGALTPTLDDLHRFFRNPTQWYARRQLGVLLPVAEENRADREPVFLAGLAKFLLYQRLLRNPAHLRAAVDHDEQELRQLEQSLAAAGELPLAGAAAATMAESLVAIEPVAAFLAEAPAGRSLPDLPLELVLEAPYRLGGELRQRAQRGLLRWTAGHLRPPFLLAAWLDHLALCAHQSVDQQRRCIMVGRAAGKKAAADIRLFGAINPSAARDLLRQLLQLWQRGQGEPLPFFPATSHAWARKMLPLRDDDRSAGKQAARLAALREFHGDEYQRAEGLDPYIGLLCRKAAPAGDWSHDSDLGPGGSEWEDFAAVAELVYGPMLRAMEKAGEGAA